MPAYSKADHTVSLQFISSLQISWIRIYFWFQISFLSLPDIENSNQFAFPSSLGEDNILYVSKLHTLLGYYLVSFTHKAMHNNQAMKVASALHDARLKRW